MAKLLDPISWLCIGCKRTTLWGKEYDPDTGYEYRRCGTCGRRYGDPVKEHAHGEG